MNYLFHVMIAWGLNQFHGHWLISDASHYGITMHLKCKKKIELFTFCKIIDGR
jgi:hypothetical protein